MKLKTYYLIKMLLDTAISVAISIASYSLRDTGYATLVCALGFLPLLLGALNLSRYESLKQKRGRRSANATTDNQ